MPDLPDWQTSVSIDAANVTITVSGSVTIASGSVTIANASIAVINATGTKITSARPPSTLGFVTAGASSTVTGSFSLPSDIQGLAIELDLALANFSHLKVSYHPTSGSVLYVPLELYVFNQFLYVVPLLPQAIDTGGNAATTIDVALTSTAAGASQVAVVALFESAPLWMQVFPLPQIEPNQAPGAILKTLAANVGQWLITPVVNVQISLFEIIELYTTNFGAADVIDVGHASTLPASQAAAVGKLIEMAPLGVTPFVYPYHGAQLPRGDGIYVINSTSAAGNFGATINYSLS